MPGTVGQPFFVAPLTGLRFLAAMAVLIGHGASMLPDDAVAFGIQQITSIGMTLFFVLSGFVLWLTYADLFQRGSFRAELREFAVARFARLYPMYALVILAGLAHHARVAFSNLPAPLLYIPMVQGWVPTFGAGVAAFSIPDLDHLWSISAEAMFYLLFPLIACLRLRRLSIIVALFTATVAVAILENFLLFRGGPSLMATIAPNLTDGMAWLTYYSPYLHLPQFIVGCLAAAFYLSARGRAVTAVEARVAPIVLLLSCIAIVALPLLYVAKSRFGALYYALDLTVYIGGIVAFPLLLVHLARYESPLQRIMSTQLVMLGGECSYSIYLLHPFINGLFFFPPLKLPTATYFSFGLRLLGMSTLTIALAWLAYHLIERPSRRWIRAKLGAKAPETRVALGAPR